MYPFWVIDMEAIEAIMRRRSIRKYTGEKITEEDITLLLKAAMNAPSAHNKQPWHFIVVDEREMLNKITVYHQYSKMLENASHAIIVLGDNNIQETDFWIHDTSAALENILIAAQAKGIGAVWLGVHPDNNLIKGTRNLFKVPEHVTPLGIVSLGMPAEEKPPRENYNEERVHRNMW
jgi:nitroreductase